MENDYVACQEEINAEERNLCTLELQSYLQNFFTSSTAAKSSSEFYPAIIRIEAIPNEPSASTISLVLIEEDSEEIMNSFTVPIPFPLLKESADKKPKPFSKQEITFTGTQNNALQLQLYETKSFTLEPYTYPATEDLSVRYGFYVQEAT